jgi:hypothetical protein
MPVAATVDFAEKRKECSNTLIFKLLGYILFVGRSGVNPVPVRFPRSAI